MPKTSTLNKLHGVVKSILMGPVTVEVVIELSGGQEVAAVITNKSAQELNLQEGSEVFAIIKATSGMVGKEY